MSTKPLTFVTLLLMVIFLTACARGPVVPSNITILISTYNAGNVETTAYRITSNGEMGGGRWNSQNQLTARYDVKNIGLQTYRDLLSAVTNIEIKSETDSETAPISGPTPVQTVEIVITHNQENQYFIFDQVPGALNIPIEAIRAMAMPLPAKSGRHIWAMSAHQETRPIDVNQSETGKLSTIEQALNSVELIVPANDDLHAFFVGKNQSRSRFVAESAQGRAYFGALVTP